MSYNLKQGQIAVWNIVEVDLRIDPGIVQRLAIVPAGDDIEADELFVEIDALLEPPHEQVDPHDAEYQPEDETYKKHVEDGRYCLNQSIYHDLFLPNTQTNVA